MNNIVSQAKNSVKKVLSNLNIIDPFNKIFSEIEFETLSYCNRKCHYCPNVDYERLGEEASFFMKENVFKTLINQLHDMNFKGQISPHLYGEPLSDPRISRWVSHIKNKLPLSKVKIVTNADFLDKEMYDKLIFSGVDVFYISKHSKKFKKHFISLIENLKKDELSNKFVFNDFYTDFKSDDQTLLNNRGGDIELKEKAYNSKTPPVNCPYVTYPVINTYGDIILCCQDFHNKYVCGNIMERHLKDIWFDKKNISLRRKIFKSRFDLQICKDCVM